ncbi:MAG: 3-oxoacyl-[acyl-carrier-protein] synthase III C-terminal domain-containing protein [Spirochaetia bacterium]|jgi:3-oxoacyl-[acyl-carrier-protein] synthase III
MRIESIGVSVPSRKVTNDDILRMLAEKSNGISPIILKTYQRMVKGLFAMAGSDIRYVRDEDKNERASDFILDAMKSALEKANLKTDDIDLLIYCGVGKGFLEPANGYFYAQKMGMTSSCFDIVDACMSWIRALEVSYEFFKSGRYKHVMILNGEFNIQHGFPDNFKIQNLRQIEYTFPTYTIGEAATATILSPSESEWKFVYKSVPALADLCTIPLDGYDNFVEPSKRLGKNGLYNFVSYGRELFDAARRYLVPVVQELVPDLNEPDIYFPHAASDAAYLTASKDICLPQEKMFAKVFPNFGNIVSASIPMGMDMALKEGRLQRGHKVVLCPASAGMVYSAVRFVY